MTIGRRVVAHDLVEGIGIVVETRIEGIELEIAG
jgi:hypothetical protein